MRILASCHSWTEISPTVSVNDHRSTNLLESAHMYEGYLQVEFLQEEFPAEFQLMILPLKADSDKAVMHIASYRRGYQDAL